MVERRVSDDDDDESSARHLRRESRIRLSEFSLALLFKERRNPPTPPEEVEEEEEDEELDEPSVIESKAASNFSSSDRRVKIDLIPSFDHESKSRLTSSSFAPSNTEIKAIACCQYTELSADVTVERGRGKGRTIVRGLNAEMRENALSSTFTASAVKFDDDNLERSIVVVVDILERSIVVVVDGESSSRFTTSSVRGFQGTRDFFPIDSSKKGQFCPAGGNSGALHTLSDGQTLAIAAGRIPSTPPPTPPPAA